jgi:hypothetical protein
MTSKTQHEIESFSSEPNPMFDEFAKGKPYGVYAIDEIRFNEFQRGWQSALSANPPTNLVTDMIADALLEAEIGKPYYFKAEIIKTDKGFNIEHQTLSANPQGWLPISTAPKDQDILVCQSANGIIDVAYGVNEYGDWKTGVSPMDYITDITHWMPLPAAPTPNPFSARFIPKVINLTKE